MLIFVVHKNLESEATTTPSKCNESKYVEESE